MTRTWSLPLLLLAACGSPASPSTRSTPDTAPPVVIAPSSAEPATAPPAPPGELPPFPDALFDDVTALARHALMDRAGPPPTRLRLSDRGLVKWRDQRPPFHDVKVLGTGISLYVEFDRTINPDHPRNRQVQLSITRFRGEIRAKAGLPDVCDDCHIHIEPDVRAITQATRHVLALADRGEKLHWRSSDCHALGLDPSSKPFRELCPRPKHRGYQIKALNLFAKAARERGLPSRLELGQLFVIFETRRGLIVLKTHVDFGKVAPFACNLVPREAPPPNAD